MKPRFFPAVRRHLLAGLVVIAPVTITAFVLWWIFERLDGLLGRFLYPVLGVELPGLGLLALLLLLVSVGWVTQRAIGARVLGWWHTVLERFPLTRRLYSASNRIVSTVFGGQQGVFKQVVLFEYPSDGRWSLGFLTAENEAMDWVEPAEDAVAVFVATMPNPTTGWVVIVPRSRIIPIAMSLEEAFTFILSAGTVPPAVEDGRETVTSPVERTDR